MGILWYFTALVLLLTSVSGAENDASVSIDVYNALEFQAACTLVGLTHDVEFIKIHKGFSMDELSHVPAPILDRSVAITGESSGEVVAAGASGTAVHLGNGTRVVMRNITLDLQENAKRLDIDKARFGVFDMEINTWLTLENVVLWVTIEQMAILAGKLGEDLKDGVALSVKKSENSRVLEFKNVTLLVFATRDETRRAARRSKTIHLASSEGVVKIDRDFGVSLDKMGNMDVVNVEIGCNVSVMDAMLSSLLNHVAIGGQMLLRSTRGGPYSIRISSEISNVTVRVLPGGFIGMQGVIFEHEAGLPILNASEPCGSMDCFGGNFGWLFSSKGEDYVCKQSLMDVTVRTTCSDVNQLWRMMSASAAGGPFSYSHLKEREFNPPGVVFGERTRKGFHVSRYARKGVCMSDLRVTCEFPGVLGMMAHGASDMENVNLLGWVAGWVIFCTGLASCAVCTALYCSKGRCRAPVEVVPVWCLCRRHALISKSGGTISVDIDVDVVHVMEDDSPVDCAPPPEPTSDPVRLPERSILESKDLKDYLSERIDKEQWEISDEVVEVQEQIGKGGYGVVYKGQWKGAPVAIKVVNFLDDPDERGEPRQRAILEAAISSSITHSNVVQTFAYCFKPKKEDEIKVWGEEGKRGSRAQTDWKMFIVQELCDWGTLKSVLDRKFLNGAVDEGVDFREVVRLALDISKGMGHLHEHGIIHGDLTSKNILLKSEGGCEGTFQVTAKIADFGLSVRLRESERVVRREKLGTPIYAAPEVCNHGVLSKKADVFSFGVILWELYHQTCPLTKSKDGRFMYHKRFPKFPIQCPMPYALLCTLCLAHEPEHRPDFAFTTYILEHALGMPITTQSAEEIRSENLKLSADMEQLGPADLLPFLKDIVKKQERKFELEIRIIDSDQGSSIMAGAVDETGGESDEFFDAMDRSLGEASTRGSEPGACNAGSSGANLNLNVTQRNEQLQQHMEEMIVAGLPLSVTVAPPVETRTRYTRSEPPQISTPNSESGSSNAFSVTIDDDDERAELLPGPKGELKFRWRPSVVPGQAITELNTTLPPLPYAGDLCVVGDDRLGHQLRPGTSVHNNTVFERQPNDDEQGLGVLACDAWMIEPASVGSVVVNLNLGESNNTDETELGFDYSTPPNVALRQPNGNEVFLSGNPLFAP